MIDWTRAIELRDEIGAVDFNEIVELFLCEVEERIESAKTRTELHELEEDLHFLKGSALNLGFRQFATLCGDGETNASQGVSIGDFNQIAQSYQSSKRVFLEQLAQKLQA